MVNLNLFMYGVKCFCSFIVGYRFPQEMVRDRAWMSAVFFESNCKYLPQLKEFILNSFLLHQRETFAVKDKF